MPYAGAFQGCCVGCDSVGAHSANRTQGSLLYMLFVEIKCQEQGPQVSLVPPARVVVRSGETRRMGHGGSSAVTVPTIS